MNKLFCEEQERTGRSADIVLISEEGTGFAHDYRCHDTRGFARGYRCHDTRGYIYPGSARLNARIQGTWARVKVARA